MDRPSFIGPDRFEPLLAMLLVTFLLVPVCQQTRVGSVVLSLLLGVVLVAALVASGVDGHRVAVGGSLGLVIVIASGVTAVFVEGEAPAWVAGVFAAVLTATTALVLRRILRQHRITLSTVAGALSVYLMLGLAFASYYRMISLLDLEAFTEQLGNSASYFSFVTLTTLGYGDIAPVSDLARSLATLEAVLGNVLLVTLVARFVGNLGQERQRQRRGPQDDGPRS